jgi:hypothetical protein
MRNRMLRREVEVVQIMTAIAIATANLRVLHQIHSLVIDPRSLS